MCTKRLVKSLAIGALLAGWGAAWGAPTVLTMPDGVRAATTDTAYAWAGKTIRFWGRVIWDPAGLPSGTYTLDCGNGTTSTGAVTNADDIGMNCTYAAAGTEHARLTVVQDGSAAGDGAGGTGSAETRIDVIIAMDTSAQINLAIERGLKFMYDRYVALGKTGVMHNGDCGYGSCNGQTASAVLAFENRGHTPALDVDADGDIDADDRTALEHQEIYAELVHKALGYVQARLIAYTIGAQTACTYPAHSGVSVNPDLNGNGKGYTDNDTDYYRDGYTLSQLIMGFVGAGKPDGDPATLDATDIPAWAGPAATGGTGGVPQTFKEMVQDMVEFYYYGQSDDGTGSYCGGWRYHANYGSSDNSPAQWPALSIDEAVVQWGIPIPQWVKDANHNWTNYSQAAGGSFGYLGSTGGTPMAMTGAGLAQLFMQNRAPGDAAVNNALNWMACNWYVNNDIYVSYGVAKSMRMGRDPAAPNTRKTIDTLTCSGTSVTHQWNDEYNAYLVATQNANGSWNGAVNIATGYIYPTAWGVEILTPALTGQPPVADAGGPYTTPAAQAVALDGCASRHEDPAKYLATYRWDFNNDGTYDYEAAAPTCTATAPASNFPETGVNYNKTVRLQVVDNLGDTDDDTAVVQVLTGDANVAPVAKPGGPYVAKVGATFTLDASGSFDPNTTLCKTIVKYEWDLDGNGSYETDAGASPTYSTSRPNPYHGQIGLRVTDDCGLSGTAATPAEIFVTDLQVLGYSQIVPRRLGPFVTQYTAKMCLQNKGSADAKNTVATLLQVPANVTIVDGNLSYGTVPAGGFSTCTDTFTINVDRRIITQSKDLRWRITYDDPSGTGSIDVVVPWL